MAAGKTGALLGLQRRASAPCSAGAGRGHVDALAGYGAQLGLAFQLVDDLLGIWGDPAVTGKPVLSRPARAQEVAAGRLRALATAPARPARAGSPGSRRRRRADRRRPGARGRRAASRRPAAGHWAPAEAAVGSTLAEQALAGAPDLHAAAPRDRAGRAGRATSSSREPTDAHLTDRAARRVRTGAERPSRSTRAVDAPARPAAPARLVEGRARDQRDDGRRGPAAAGVPRHPRPRRRPTRRPAGSGPSSATTAPGRPSTAGPATCPPPSRRGSRCGWPATTADAAAHARRPPSSSAASGGIERDPGVHPDLAGAVRAVVLGRPARPAAGADLPAEVVPAQHLRLGLLGPADHRAADRRRRRLRPVPAAAVRRRRAAHRAAPRTAAPPLWTWAGAFQRLDGSCTRYARHPVRPLRRRAMRRAARVDPRPAGGRRVAGAASSRPGCTRCSRCTCSATRWTTRRCAPGSRGLDGFIVRETDPTARCAGWRPASRRSGTPAWR